MAQAILDTAVLEGFGGELLRDGDPGYDDARRVFNAGIDRRPALIARCTGAADVIAAIGFARDMGLQVSVRGGGHSVAGHAVVEGGLMIDLRPMNRVRVDPEQRTAWCGGGANWGQLDRETQAFGLAVTGGRMADTGVGGLTLGGGSGWLERKCGFTVDSLISAEVVTADGRLVVASADRNPDLFWALKGGGGNFGVVTGFEFALHEVGPLVFGGMLLFPIDAAVDLLKAYRGFMEGAPDEICGGAAIFCAPPEEFVPEAIRGEPVLAVIACYVGPVEAGERALAPLREWGPALGDEEPAPRPAPASAGEPRWGRRAVLAALGLAFVTAIFAVAFWALTRANFIGVNEDGDVAVYQGLPWDLGGGVHLYRPRYVSQLQAVQLTPSERAVLLDHKLSSYDAARDQLYPYEQEASP